MKDTATHNSTYPKMAVQCSADTFVVIIPAFAKRKNFSAYLKKTTT